jgi:hypothetical protein
MNQATSSTVQAPDVRTPETAAPETAADGLALWAWGVLANVMNRMEDVEWRARGIARSVRDRMCGEPPRVNGWPAPMIGSWPIASVCAARQRLVYDLYSLEFGAPNIPRP